MRNTLWAIAFALASCASGAFPGALAPAFADAGAKTKVIVLDDQERGAPLRFDVPSELLAPRLADEARGRDAVRTYSLYLTLKYLPGVNVVAPPSAKELHQGSPDTVHVFIKPVSRSHQKNN